MGRLAVALGMFSLCMFSVPLCAQEDPLAWFPLQVGSRWAYDYEARSGNRSQPNVDRWTTEETITAQVTVPEGLVLLRDVKLQVSPGEPTSIRRVIAPNGQLRSAELPASNRRLLSARDGQPYLVRGNCIYLVENGWDAASRELRPEYRKYLANHEISPDFCFPLQTGRSWGNRDISWQVGPAREGMAAFLPAEYAGAIHIFSDHFGSGGSEDVWFQKGVGIVATHHIHNGTYDEYVKKLRSHTP